MNTIDTIREGFLKVEGILAAGAVTIFTDTEKILYIDTVGEMNITRAIGDNLELNETIKKAIETESTVMGTGDKSVWGEDLMMQSNPIRESDGTIIGALTVAHVKKTGDSNVGVESVGRLVRNEKSIAEKSKDISGELDKTRQQLIKIDKMISYIKDTSLQLKLLGLNASIESVKAGEAGKGFGIVAKEMSTMAEDSKTSSENIVKELKDIRMKIESLFTDIHVISDMSADQYEAMKNLEEISK